MSLNSVSKIENVLNEESFHGIGATMCCSLNYFQHFHHQMTRILKHEFWNKSFEDRFAHPLDIPRRLHQRADCNHAKFLMLQEKVVCEISWYKIMGISKSTYMS